MSIIRIVNGPYRCREAHGCARAANTANRDKKCAICPEHCCIQCEEILSGVHVVAAHTMSELCKRTNIQYSHYSCFYFEAIN